ncbi:119aa long hypothetical protein [Pyrococcus horikoshii OT3]|uniref:Uncharacterized protein n=1 Tax=Pyrococcus horikoshii (strain ATCC 700860 / DSM 12428 / JCM 9974 / NBRC 100139 / OT-3) TaxID=70601 RepID=O58936_PYRHO|nr:119aa long hypothetical protein [Pyrococcus horikoshii OT3]
MVSTSPSEFSSPQTALCLVEILLSSLLRKLGDHRHLIDPLKLSFHPSTCLHFPHTTSIDLQSESPLHPPPSSLVALVTFSFSQIRRFPKEGSSKNTFQCIPYFRGALRLSLHILPCILQ